ncbi:cation:proton antiporter [Fenollaria sporofastidiosus]|uniref:cation:proton antiporter n=1 Tax=Fenollaria sporofastidiosus TaxID=2811778 RepID=UPI001C0046C4|nr:cation:proton antiporter [Fenollaria sporofastidiosus]
MNFEILLHLGTILLVGFIVAKLLGLLKFPEVTGYLIAGILIGPSVFGFIPEEAVKSFDIISEVALAFIAFSIGAELKFDDLKKVGKAIFLITILEALVAFFLVTVVMLLLKQSLPFSLAIGSIACATAPAATLMVIKQYKAEGPLVRTLIPVVALDDGVCIIAFGVASTLAQNMIQGGAFSMMNMVGKPIIQIFSALALGIVAGIIMVKAMNFMKNQGQIQVAFIGVIFLLAAISLRFDLSSLLTMMAFGTTICNTSSNEVKVFTAIEVITPAIFLCFFVLSGADLDLSSLTKVGVLGAAYVVARVIGKALGAGIGAKIGSLSSSVQQNLGFCLVPQAGVAIGLSLIAKRIIPAPHGAAIRDIILSATVIYELIGPLLTKMALFRAGEIKKENI